MEYKFPEFEEPFDGTEIDWITRVSHVLTTHAANCCSTGLHVLHYILTEAERDEEEEALEYEIVRPEPPAQGATPAEVEVYRQQLMEYRTFSQEVARLRSWFLSLIPMDVRARVSTVRNVEFSRLTFPEMRAHLMAVYGEPNSAASRELLNELHAPYTSGTDLAAHIKKLDRTFDYFERIIEPFSPYMQYEILVRTMASHEDYATFIGQYEIAGTRTYAALSRALLAHRSHLTSVANAARRIQQVSNAPVHGTAAEVSSIQGFQVAKPTKYCWTHGLCFHTSSECKNRKSGHQVKATDKHRMGGSDTEAPPKLVRA